MIVTQVPGSLDAKSTCSQQTDRAGREIVTATRAGQFGGASNGVSKPRRVVRKVASDPDCGFPGWVTSTTQSSGIFLQQDTALNFQQSLPKALSPGAEGGEDDDTIRRPARCAGCGSDPAQVRLTVAQAAGWATYTFTCGHLPRPDREGRRRRGHWRCCPAPGSALILCRVRF